MSRPINKNMDMTNCLALGVQAEFDNRRINTLEAITEALQKASKLSFDAEQMSLVEEIIGYTNQLDDMWKQNQKNDNRIMQLIMLCNDSFRKEIDELTQQKSTMEKRIKELEANVVSDDLSLDPEEKKHDNSNSAVPAAVGADGKSKERFAPRINKKNIKEVFRSSNYYSAQRIEKYVGEQMLKWSKRSLPQLLAFKSTNDAHLKKAANDLAQIISRVPKWLMIKLAIERLVAHKRAINEQLERSALDRASLQARQEKERRDQRRAMENAKRAREDLRDAMFNFRQKKPSVELGAEPARVHFAELDEYDYNDGFAVEDHESEADEGDDLGALSDALNDLEVAAASESEAPVEELD